MIAKEPIHILNLLTKKGGRRIIYTPLVIYTMSFYNLVYLVSLFADCHVLPDTMPYLLGLSLFPVLHIWRRG